MCRKKMDYVLVSVGETMGFSQIVIFPSGTEFSNNVAGNDPCESHERHSFNYFLQLARHTTVK